MASENDVRMADVHDYWSECGEDSFHYTYFHTESCNGVMHSIVCCKPDHHDHMTTLEACTENCAVYQREKIVNPDDFEETDTTKRLQECDTESCNGYMHTVLCTNPARHDRMASFFFCNARCEIYQQRIRKLEKRMTTPAVSVPVEYLDPKRDDVDEVDALIAEQDTRTMDNDYSVSSGDTAISEVDTRPIDKNDSATSCVYNPEENDMETDDRLNQTISGCAQEAQMEQPKKTPKTTKKRERIKNSTKNEVLKKKQKRSSKRKIQNDERVFFLFIEEPQQLAAQDGEP